MFNIFISFSFWIIIVLLATRTIAALTPQFAANDNAEAQDIRNEAKHNNRQSKATKEELAN